MIESGSCLLEPLEVHRVFFVPENCWNTLLITFVEKLKKISIFYFAVVTDSTVPLSTVTFPRGFDEEKVDVLGRNLIAPDGSVNNDGIKSSL